MTAGHADGFLDPDASRAYLRDRKSRVDKMAAGAEAVSALITSFHNLTRPTEG
jgi:hypothetical protein